MSVRVKVEGLSELKAQLDRLRRATGRAALRRAGLAAMEPMARRIRALAPKDTGELSESIDVGFAARDEDVGRIAYRTAMKGGASADEALGAMRDARRSVKGARGDLYVDVFVGPVAGRERNDVIKGFVLEFGTATREPHPYMRPGFEQEKDDVLQRLRKELEFEVFAAVEKAAQRGTLRG